MARLTRVRRILQERGISVYEVARALGITPTYASVLVHGMVGERARRKWAPHLARLLRIPEESVFELEEVGEVKEMAKMAQGEEKAEGQERRTPGPRDLETRRG